MLLTALIKTWYNYKMNQMDIEQILNKTSITHIRTSYYTHSKGISKYHRFYVKYWDTNRSFHNIYMDSNQF